MVSLDATTYDVTLQYISPIESHFFRVLCDESPLDPMDISNPVTSPSISHCSYLPGFPAMMPFP